MGLARFRLFVKAVWIVIRHIVVVCVALMFPLSSSFCKQFVDYLSLLDGKDGARETVVLC